MNDSPFQPHHSQPIHDPIEVYRQISCLQPVHRAIDVFRQIRLLQLQWDVVSVQGISTLQAKWSLSPACYLEYAPNFVAISHAWGSEKEHFPLGQSTIEVPKDMSTLLKMIQIRKNPKLLESPELPDHYWVDSICIDQANAFERDKQMELMQKIYAKAKFTIIWLGPGDMYSNMAMDHLRSHVTFYSKNYGLPPNQLTVALLQVLNKEYWSRLWIVQEVLSSQDIWLLCGSKMADWRGLQTFFSQSSDSEKNRLLASSRARTLVRLKETWQTGRSPLSALLSELCGVRSTIPTDKISGLLKISSDNAGDIYQLLASCSESYQKVHDVQKASPNSPLDHEIRHLLRTCSTQLGLHRHKNQAIEIPNGLSEALFDYLKDRSTLLQKVVNLEYPTDELRESPQSKEYQNYIARILGMPIERPTHTTFGGAPINPRWPLLSASQMPLTPVHGDPRLQGIFQNGTTDPHSPIIANHASGKMPNVWLNAVNGRTLQATRVVPPARVTPEISFEAEFLPKACSATFANRTALRGVVSTPNAPLTDLKPFAKANSHPFVPSGMYRSKKS